MICLRRQYVICFVELVLVFYKIVCVFVFLCIFAETT